ncbi:MAG: hypothetical protein HY927_05340 [Elusimicrobia bacterium]|nr:hypothetical protein [Elusimicrobiota bacterium]
MIRAAFVVAGWCALLAASAASAAPVAGPQDMEARRGILLTGVAKWKLMVPEGPNDPVRRTFLPQFERIEAEARKPEAALDELDKQFTMWKNLLLSELQATGGYKNQEAFLELSQQRMRALVTVQRLEASEGAAGRERVSFWKSRINDVRDAASLKRLYDNMRSLEGDSLVRSGSAAARFPHYVAQDPVFNAASPRTRPEQAATPPAPGSGGVLDFLDWDRAKKLAASALRNARTFVGLCYGYVQKSLNSILPAGWRGEVRQASAYQFASSLNANPKLFDKLKLRRLPVEELGGGLPPVGSIVVYGRGQCGFSPEHGHIEIVVSHDPPKVCSDGCTALTPGRLMCIRKGGAKGGVNVYIPAREKLSSEPSDG